MTTTVREAEITKALGNTQIEMETQRGMALQRPRDLTKAYNRAIDELNAFPEFADKAFYSIPYKSQGKTVLIEGPSIRASCALQRAFGNSASGARMVNQDGDRIIVEGVFIDYESNTRFHNEIVVSRNVTKRDGTTYPLSQKHLDAAIQSGMSKAQRNATLKGLPVPYVMGYFKEAKRLAVSGAKGNDGKKLTPEEQVKAMYKLFASKKMGVSGSVLDKYVEETMSEKSPGDIAGSLKGLYNAIRDGETTVADAFGTENKKVPEPKGKKKPDSLTAEITLDRVTASQTDGELCSFIYGDKDKDGSEKFCAFKSPPEDWADKNKGKKISIPYSFAESGGVEYKKITGEVKVL